jgi:hypothetical protein
MTECVMTDCPNPVCRAGYCAQCYNEIVRGDSDAT